MTFAKSLSLLAVGFTLLYSSAASARSIDMDDPRRALGREGDVRIDAQLSHETVAEGAPIGVTYQVQNLSSASIAVANNLAEASYDIETRTITVAIGSEVPVDGNMPRVATVAPGEKKVFRVAATPVLNRPAIRASGGAVPRFVQVKVSVLRNLAPFMNVIRSTTSAPQPLPDELFDLWFESNDTILLNTIPVRFTARRGHSASAERRRARGSF